jgi:hypothetical protein
VLHAHGFNVQILPPSKNSGFLAKTEVQPNGVERLVSLQIPDDADVIVVQRPAHPFQPAMIEMMRANGVAVVVDMDDDMSTIHPNNIAYQTYRHRSSSMWSWKYAAESCKRATLVTTTTPALQKTYAKHGRGVILDNYVPKVYLTTPKFETGAFGWSGSMASHPNDPQVTRPAVQRLIDAGYAFMIIGEGKEKARQAFGLRSMPTATGTTNMAEWLIRIAEAIDVGMVPLDATSFNTAKSRLKGIEFMSAGIPWVASPRAEYRKLLKDAGCGFLAENARDWYNMVKRLLDDDVLREEQAQAGKAYMETQTYEANAWRWAEAWEHAYKMERG